jgi:UDP-N-acetylglucosamine:LPS N-acetylglucosamine transferase
MPFEVADTSWMPATVAQKAALDSKADILLFGGSAGSLKTETMLMDAVQEYENPNLRAGFTLRWAAFSSDLPNGPGVFLPEPPSASPT